MTDPALVKLILVKEFNRFKNRRELKTYHQIVNKNIFHSRNEEWKKIRALTSCTFTDGKLKKLYILVRKCLRGYLDYLEQLSIKQETFNVKLMHENLTLDVFACCAFATKTNSLKEPNDPLIENCHKVFHMKATQFIPALIFPKWLNRFLKVKSFTDENANQYIFNLIKQIIKVRKGNVKENNDFLQLLMDAKLEDREKETNDTLNNYIYLNDGIYKLHFTTV